MRRRKFVGHLGALIPAALLSPSFLHAMVAPKQASGNVVIVGAGAAGLYAAKVLKDSGVNVIILEASALHGGRVRPLEGFSDFPVEAGAEFVHGKGNTAGSPPSFLWSSVNDYNSDLLLEFGDYKEIYQIGTGYEIDPYWDAGLEDAYNFYLNMYAYTGDEVLMSDYLLSTFGIDETHPYWHIYEAWIGSEFGTTIKRIGMKSIAISENLWLTGDRDFLLDISYLELLDNLFFNPILPDIQYNKEVIAVDYSGLNTTVTCADGSTFITDKVIITVPLPILQENTIVFNPLLSFVKSNAINSLQMGAGMKLILKFSTNFWGDDVQGLTVDGHCSYVWAPGKGKTGGTDNVLICFIMGENAEYMSSIDAGAVDVALAELDLLFSGAATANFVDSFIQDWSLEPFVKGAYTFPALNTYLTETDTTRIDLALPIDCKLFFAGEATSNNHPATVHGALESGARAAAEVLECFLLPVQETLIAPEVDIYENNGIAYFNITASVIITANLSLIGIDGKLVKQLYFDRIPAGENVFQFEINNFAKATYFLRADIEGVMYSKQIEIR